MQQDTKSMTVAYVLWFFLGSFGAHRFYMGRNGSGFGMLGLCLGSMLLTLVLIGVVGFLALGVWWVVDAFLIPKWMSEVEVASTTADTGEPPMSQAA
jgi:TM2 domain-containing membrane protein YozV